MATGLVVLLALMSFLALFDAFAAVAGTDSRDGFVDDHRR
jgi:hypothetical protein